MSDDPQFGENLTFDSASIYDQEEVHENCTVVIWRNSVTGDESVGWWDNE